MSGVYLIHFARPLAHARHYLGSAKDVEQRIAKHRRGNGSRLMQVIRAANIPWLVSNVWRTESVDAARTLERKMKRQKNAARYCSACRRGAK